jgi:hypothetical protein
MKGHSTCIIFTCTRLSQYSENEKAIPFIMGKARSENDKFVFVGNEANSTYANVIETISPIAMSESTQMRWK